MRPATFGLGLSKRYVLAVVTITMLASPAWATIKYKRYDTREADEKSLKAAGWTTTFLRDLQTYALPDKAVLQRTANELVGRSVRALPEVVAAQISSAMKHEIARLTREALAKASMEEREIVKTGRMGSLLYKVGALQYYHVNYNRYGMPSSSLGGLSPFVALMPAGYARSMEAKITIRMGIGMPAETKIFFNGEPTTQTGDQRVFTTPPLEVGKNYQYEVVARWQENAKPIERSRKVSVSGGDAGAALQPRPRLRERSRKISLTGGDSVNVDFNLPLEDRIAWKWTSHTGGRKTAEECSFAYSADRQTVVRVLGNGADPDHKWIRLYDAATDKPLGPKIALDAQRVTALAVSPNGKTVAVGFRSKYNDHDAGVAVMDATTGKRGLGVGYYPPPPLVEVFDVAFFQNGRFVLVIALPKGGK